MPYTLMMGLVWFGLAFALGLLVGLVLRSVTARREVLRAQLAAGGDPATIERLRARLGELDNELAQAHSARTGAASTGQVLAGGSAGRDEFGLGVQLDLEPWFEPDDLTAIVGLGPHLAELCHGIGIDTWQDLAETEVSLLRTLLDDAGARYRVHDPSTWPVQAGLLAEGRWQDFTEYAESLFGAVTAADEAITTDSEAATEPIDSVNATDHR